MIIFLWYCIKWTYLLMSGGILLLFVYKVIDLLKPIWQHSKRDLNYWKGKKKIIVTGCSEGLGKEIVLQLADMDLPMEIVVCARRIELLEDLKRTVEAKYKKCRIYPLRCDLSDEAECEKLIQESVKILGLSIPKGLGIDALILNAGISSHLLLEQMESLKPGERIMNLNFWGCVRPVYHAFPYLKVSKGAVCCVSSIAGLVGTPRRTFYSGSKFGIRGFMQSLRREWKKYGISVSSVCPGYVATRIHFNSVGADKGVIKRDLSRFMSIQDAVSYSLYMMERNMEELVIPISKRVQLLLSVFLPEFVREWAIEKAKGAVSFKTTK